MMKKCILLMTLLVATAALAAHTEGTLVTCESLNNIKHTCKVDVRSGVTLNRQLSDNVCIQGQTWGISRKGRAIWVDKGCRGEFLVTPRGAARAARFGRTLLCESQDGKRHRCPADTSYGVQLARQISKNSCVRGRDWGFDDQGIWVTNGCRAEFTTGTTSSVGMASSSRPTVLCESANGKRNFCRADTTFGVTVSRQISDTACIRGENWNYDNEGIWVDRGCRAEFILDSIR